MNNSFIVVVARRWTTILVANVALYHVFLTSVGNLVWALALTCMWNEAGIKVIQWLALTPGFLSVRTLFLIWK